MSAALEMPPIVECTVAGCSYNDHSNCHAIAITVGGRNGDAECATFIPLSAKGGLASRDPAGNTASGQAVTRQAVPGHDPANIEFQGQDPANVESKGSDPANIESPRQRPNGHKRPQSQ